MALPFLYRMGLIPNLEHLQIHTIHRVTNTTVRRRIAIMAFLWSKLLEESGMDLNIELPTASLTSDSQKDDLIGVNIGTEVGMKVIITWSTICIIPFWWFRYA